MSIIRIEGFDLYSDAAAMLEHWISSGTVSFGVTAGRYGGGAMYLNSSGARVYYQLPDNNNFINIGFALKMNGAQGANLFAWLDTMSGSLSDSNMSLSILADGSLEVRGDSYGSGSSNLSATGIIAPDSWYYIEVYCERSGSGNCIVYVNGVEVINATEDFLESTALSVVSFGTFASGPDFYIDDIYIGEDASAFPGSPLGDCRIETILPNADTAQADWSLNTGSDGYALIDDALGTDGDGDTTYISATTVNDASEFEMGNLTGSPTSVYAVGIRTRSSKTDSGTIAYTHYLLSGSVEGSGSEIAPSESAYALTAVDVFTLDPQTAAAWTVSGVNALVLGVEITS